MASADLRLLGELPAALRAAEVGTHADPSATRPVVAYAQAAAGRRDPVAAVAYERAMALTFPSSAQCRGLVAALEALGDVYAAQVWTGRWLGLRPAETAAATELQLRPEQAAAAFPRGLSVQWLGTSGFALTYEGRRVLIDPYVTRVPLSAIFRRRALQPARDRIAQLLGTADAVLVGHTHFDHAMDVPAVAALTGARVYGSRSAAKLLALHDLERQAIELDDRIFERAAHAAASAGHAGAST